MGGVISRPKAPTPPPVAKPVAKAFTDLAESQGKKLEDADTPGTAAYSAKQDAARRRARRIGGRRSLLGGGRGEGGETQNTLGAG